MLLSDPHYWNIVTVAFRQTETKENEIITVFVNFRISV